MKLFVIILLLTGKIFSQQNANFKIPTIDSYAETFDKSVFSKGDDGHWEKIVRSGDTISVYHSQNSYEESKNGLTLKLCGQSDSGEIFSYEYSENKMFAIYKEFYANGNIKRKGLLYCCQFHFGTWYHFNENAKLVKSENTDLGYKFTFQDVFKYCSDNQIRLDKSTLITKNKKPGRKKYWTIVYWVNPETNGISKINAKTGRATNREQKAVPIAE
jgi:hypothetical protein